MYIWTIGLLNQLFITATYTQIKFSKKVSQWLKSVAGSQWQVISGKSPSFLMGPFCLNIGF